VTPLAAGAALEVELRLDGYAPTNHLFAAIEAPQLVRLVRARRRPATQGARGGATTNAPATMRAASGSAYERFD
jgi:hypothetical protein